MGSPDSTESKKKLRRLAKKKKRNMERKTKIQKKKKEQECREWINISGEQDQGNKKKVRERVTRLATEIAIWKYSVFERAAWNSQAVIMLGPDKEIADQENVVNFLLQHPVVFECLSRLSIEKSVTGKEKWNIQTSQVIKILQ